MLKAITVVPLLLAVGSSAIAQDGTTYKPGDCVEYDTTNAIDPAARWRKGRITGNDGYFFSIALEPRAGGNAETTTVSVASAHKWLRSASGCTGPTTAGVGKASVGAPPKTVPEPARRAEATATKPAGECPFTKAYQKVSNTAPASADLFKGVIFEWEYGLNKRFQDFGVTFQSFQMGKPFENRVYPGVDVRRDVDAAPPGTTIYPLKARLLVCQKDISITIRRVWEIEYSCFKDKFDAWACANHAPRQLEHATLPNQ